MRRSSLRGGKREQRERSIYFPIGVSRLTREDKNIVNAVADVLKADASKKYDVKGYADTYTGSDAINNRLRNQRAGNVVKQLVSRGVSADQVQAVPVQRRGVRAVRRSSLRGGKREQRERSSWSCRG